MADQEQAQGQQPTPPPDGGAGQHTGPAQGQSPAGGANAGPQQAEGQRPQPFAVFEDARAFERRMDREARRRMNDAAKAAGFDDWEHMTQEVGARQPARKGETPARAQADGPSDADRLQMALDVGARLNLPAALIARLRGRTPEEMEADAQTLLGLMRPQGPQAPQAGPGIPAGPQSNQVTTFTREQLQDPKFVREHKDDILRASREGRIVRS